MSMGLLALARRLRQCFCEKTITKELTLIAFLEFTYA